MGEGTIRGDLPQKISAKPWLGGEVRVLRAFSCPTDSEGKGVLKAGRWDRGLRIN